MTLGLLADCVDTSLAIVYYIVVQQMRCSVKCTISDRDEKGADALSLCGSWASCWLRPNTANVNKTWRC